jgi:signal transduction histidine kinase
MLTVLRERSPRGDFLSLEVTDNGIGMSREGRERIFLSFSQAERDTVSRFGGSGLGLALTKRFVEMMGGSISVRSEPGLGSSFTLLLPAVEATACARAA